MGGPWPVQGERSPTDSMAPHHEHKVSSNGRSAVVEQEQITDSNLRTVREQVVEAIDPLQKQLDATLHELDETLRPRLQQPVKDKPLIAVAVAAAGGVLLGGLTVLALLAGGGTRPE